MSRYGRTNKSIIALIIVVLLCFIWMTSQVRSPGLAGLPETGTSKLTYPFAVALNRTSGFFKGIWSGYFGLVSVRSDNERLKAENGRLAQENLRLREESAGFKRLCDLQAVNQETTWPTIAARVIGRDATSWFKSAWIDRGDTDGVGKYMPAMVYTGIVGRVAKTYGGTSRLLLITDTNSSVSGIIERSREPGLLVGDGSGGCKMTYVGKSADIKQGDLVITSGLDGIFPAGLLIGQVARVSGSSPGYFLDVDILPTADINRLEEVMILKYTPPARPKETEAETSAVKKLPVR